MVYDLGEVLVAGGAPAEASTLDEAWGDGRVPDPLWEVLRHHDGLGPLGVRRAPFGVPRLLPVADLAPLTRWMRFGEENILYAPAEWLRFSVSLEGGWCVSTAGAVRWWDAGDHGLGPLASWHDVWDHLWTDWSGG